MKFVCENCKAKYQIGDDKVAGKTLRMKCRRCGHMIQVSATVTESSVSKLNPAMPPPAGLPHIGSGLPPGPSAQSFSSRENVPNLGLHDEPTSTGGDDDSATMVRASPLFLRATGSAMPVARPSSARIVPPARPSGRISNPPGAPLPPGLSATGAFGAAPRAPFGTPRPTGGLSSPGGGLRPAGGPLAARAAAAVARPQTVPPPSSAPPSAGLSGGFSRAVAAAPAAVPSHAPPTEDWYVGVGGVPLGPVRLSVIREKAAAGAVDGDSLVWREGFEEWQPLRSFPALLSVIEEARSTRASRPMLTPVPPQPRHYGGTPSPFAANGAQQNSGIPAPATSVPFSLVTPAAAGPRGLEVMPDPFAASGSQAKAQNDQLFGASAAVGDRPSVESASISLGAPMVNGFGTDAGSMIRDSISPPLSAAPERKRGVHPMAWAFIAMCAAFGGVAAWAVFLRAPQPIIQSTATVPVGETARPFGAAPPAPPTNLPSASPAVSVAGGTPSNPSVGAGGSVVGPKSTKPEASSAPPSNFDPSGFSTGGPNAGPNSTGPSSGTGQLTQGEIEGVVTRNKPGITRRCWGPAYDARDANAPKSAKVNVSLTIGPSGSVQSSSASGGDHFPGLASCVGGAVKGWQFKPSDGTTPVNIPFSFNQQ